MRGPLLIDRETTDGDRAIVATVDPERGKGYTLDDAIRQALDVMAEGGVWAVRVIWDRPDRDSDQTLFYSDHSGRQWRRNP